jgi:predicted phosphodiesterase
MRYALISDIHGNLPAFEAVLSDAKKKDIDSYIFLGDYYRDINYPNEVVDIIKDIKNKYIIRGNSEYYLEILSNQDQNTWEKGQFNSLYWNYKELTAQNIKYLCSLPDKIIVKDKYIDIYVSHSSKTYFDNTSINNITSRSFKEALMKSRFSPTEYIEILKNNLKKDKQLEKHLFQLPDAIYIFGHNHIQMNLQLDKKLIVNPGSCGIPLDFSDSASYSILETSSLGCKVEEFRIKYNVGKLISQLKTSDLYKSARIWSELIIKALITGNTHIGYFLRFIDQYAKKPYSQKVWEEAYEIWNKQN